MLMDFERHARDCRISYSRRDGRAGTIEYLRDGNEFTFRGTARNKIIKTESSLYGKTKSWLSLARDILADVRIMPRYNKELGWRPGGFRDAALDVVAEIEPMIFTNPDPIILKGHSLGAITAILAAEVLTARGHNIERVFAFAPPKGGRLKHLDPSKVVAFRYGRDIVTELPISWRRTVKCRHIGHPGDVLEDHAIERTEEWLSGRNRDSQTK